MLNGKKKLIAAGALALVVLAWAGAAASLALFELTLAQWTIIVTVCALVTEAAMWIGAVLLGIEAIGRLRARLRFRRAR
jgi:uncharacterized membrane protein